MLAGLELLGAVHIVAHQQSRQKMNIAPSEITITPLDEQFIKRAIALVEQNIGDSDFSVETMSAEVGMARTTLYKRLMAITGLGPAEFIRTIRVKRGKALLETSQMQITEIAYAVDFHHRQELHHEFQGRVWHDSY